MSINLFLYSSVFPVNWKLGLEAWFWLNIFGKNV